MKAVCDDIDTRSGETALLREAAERIRDMDRAMRAHISNMTVKGLPSFIALSRHQFELASFVNERRGGRTEKPVMFLLKDHATGESRPMTIEREPEREISEEEREMFDDISWRAHALNGVLDDFQKKLTVNNFGELIELSNHQCELVDYLSTGKFRKAPRRRKARTLGTEGITPESQERIEALGEALNEYQGRIEIKNLREFIALSKHQCELAGMMADYLWGGRKKNERLEDRIILNLVHYGEAYPEAVNVSGPVGKRPRERGKSETTRTEGEEERFVLSEPEGRVEKRPSTARTRGASASPGVPFCDTFGHAKVSRKNLDAPTCPAVCRIESEHDGEKRFSHRSTTPFSIPNRAMPGEKKTECIITIPSPVKVKTFPVLIEGEVRTEDGEPESVAVVRGGIRAGVVKHCYNAGTDRQGRFSKSIEIETSPGVAQRVLVWGKAVDRIYDMPLPFARLRVKISSDGFTRSFECEANGNGEFSRTFECSANHASGVAGDNGEFTRTFEREGDDGFP